MVSFCLFIVIVFFTFLALEQWFFPCDINLFNVLFIYNMPLRALAKNAGQFVSMGLVDALVREIQGWGLCGLVPAAIVQIFAGDFFLLVWFLWFFVPLAYELIKNLVLNARGEKLLAAQDRN